TGRAGTGGAADPGYATDKGRAGLTLVTKSPTDPGAAADRGLGSGPVSWRRFWPRRRSSVVQPSPLGLGLTGLATTTAGGVTSPTQGRHRAGGCPPAPGPRATGFRWLGRRRLGPVPVIDRPRP